MNVDQDSAVDSKSYSMNEIQLLKIGNKNKSLSMFHINVCSLNKNFDDLEYLLKCTNKISDVAVVAETRITRITSRH